jgi:hypothetical protein
LTRRSVSLMIRLGRDIFAGDRLVERLVAGLVRELAEGVVVLGELAVVEAEIVDAGLLDEIGCDEVV